ncbi:MAG: hypothetical protein ACOCRB_00640 [Halanaerobiaceae bacterium]
MKIIFFLGLGEKAQKMIKVAREVTAEFNIFACTPRNDLIKEWDDNVLSEAHSPISCEAYLLANPGEEYAFYLPDGGTLELEIEDMENYICYWYDIDEQKWYKKENVGSIPVLESPDSGQRIGILK